VPSCLPASTHVSCPAARITRKLEGRTENAVKNHWNAAMRAKVSLAAATLQFFFAAASIFSFTCCWNSAMRAKLSLAAAALLLCFAAA
jgi:hypothetical protein